MCLNVGARLLELALLSLDLGLRRQHLLHLAPHALDRLALLGVLGALDLERLQLRRRG